MAVIRDVMPAFELYQPASTDDAVALLAQYGEDAWVMAGGLDSFDWLKDRIKRPKIWPPRAFGWITVPTSATARKSRIL